MRNILILDAETTGLDPSTDSVIEVGCILYSVEYATPLVSLSSLIHAEENPAEAVNRIPAAALRAVNSTAANVWRTVAGLAVEADAIVAHDAAFHRAFAPPELRDLRPWICSMDDLQWPRMATRLLLAFTGPRAIGDCELLARLFTIARELGEDIEEMLARGLRPKAVRP